MEEREEGPLLGDVIQLPLVFIENSSEDLLKGVVMGGQGGGGGEGGRMGKFVVLITVWMIVQLMLFLLILVDVDNSQVLQLGVLHSSIFSNVDSFIQIFRIQRLPAILYLSLPLFHSLMML